MICFGKVWFFFSVPIARGATLPIEIGSKAAAKKVWMKINVTTTSRRNPFQSEIAGFHVFPIEARLNV